MVVCCPLINISSVFALSVFFSSPLWDRCMCSAVDQQFYSAYGSLNCVRTLFGNWTDLFPGHIDHAILSHVHSEGTLCNFLLLILCFSRSLAIAVLLTVFTFPKVILSASSLYHISHSFIALLPITMSTMAISCVPENTLWEAISGL